MEGDEEASSTKSHIFLRIINFRKTASFVNRIDISTMVWWLTNYEAGIWLLFKPFPITSFHWPHLTGQENRQELSLSAKNRFLDTKLGNLANR